MTSAAKQKIMDDERAKAAANDKEMFADEQWKKSQTKTFRGWANIHLGKRSLKIENLFTDFANGILLIDLVEEISGKHLKRNKNPKVLFQELENITNVLTFLEKEGIELTGIDSAAVHAGKEKLILGLMWSLILRFLIQHGMGGEMEEAGQLGEGPRSELLKWLSEVTGVMLKTFNGFQDGMIMAKLANYLTNIQGKPKPFEDPNGMKGCDWPTAGLRNNDAAMDSLMRDSEVPKILDADTVIQEKPDDLSLMTYCALIKKRAEELEALQAANATKSRAFGPGTESGDVSTPAVFTIQSIDHSGANKTAGGDHFEVTITGPEELPADIKDNGNGTYTVTWHPRLEGPYMLRVTQAGNRIANGPFKPFITNKTSAANTTCFGPGLVKGDTAHPCVFTIKAADMAGLPRESGGDTFEITVNGPEEVPAEVKDNRDGTYTVTYEPEKAGTYTVSVALEGQLVDKSPYQVPITEGVKAGNSFADGPGWEKPNNASPAVFTIHAVSPNGAPKTTGGDVFTVSIMGPTEELPAEIADNGDGTYTVTYEPEVVGPHTISVTYDDQPIRDSPKVVNVTEGADNGKSKCFGPGLEKGDTAHPAVFTIQAVNRDGKNKSTGGDPFTVDVTGPEDAIAEVTDNHNGTYSVAYRPERPGTYNVAVNIYGRPVDKSVYHVPIKEGTDAGKTYAFGPGLEKADTANPAVFTIQSVGPDGQKKTHGGDTFTVDVGGPEEVPAEIKDNNDGTYTVTYQPEAPGTYRVAVSNEGAPIKDSPFNVACRDAADARNSKVFGPGVERGDNTHPCVFTIQAVGPKGQPVPHGGDPFQVHVGGPEEVPADIADHQNGTYTVTYRPTKVGTYNVAVTLLGKHVDKSAYAVPIGEGADPAKSYAHGPGLQKADTTNPAKFTIQSVNRDGQPKKSGGDPFQVSVMGPREEVPVEITDNNDGTYTVTYEPEHVGPHKINVTLLNDPIKDMPHVVNVQAGTSLDKTRVVGASFVLHTKKKGGPMKTTGGDEVVVTVAGVPASVTDNGNGTYTVNFEVKQRGEHQIDVKIGGKVPNWSPIRQAF